MSIWERAERLNACRHSALRVHAIESEQGWKAIVLEWGGGGNRIVARGFGPTEELALIDALEAM